MSHTAVDEKLSSLEHHYTESFRRAIEDDDHETVARLAASYDAKTRRLNELKNPHTTPLRRATIRAMALIG
jgi:hypothetical protein